MPRKEAEKINKLEIAKILCQRAWGTSNRDYLVADLSKDLKEIALSKEERNALLDWMPLGGGGTTGDRVRAVYNSVLRIE